MLQQESFCKKNAVPLIEFIQMIRGRRSVEGRSSFPRRFNGRLASIPELRAKDEVDTVDWNHIQQHLQLEEEEEKKVELVLETKPAAILKGKRRRSIGDNPVSDTKFVRSPFACEILTKSSKGMYSSTYVDIELSSLGLEPLVQDVSGTRKIGKLLVGVRCCYLRLGTALVVSGCIVEVNMADFTAQVVPDKGLCLDVKWVSLEKLYCIPDNLTDVRKTVSERVFSILQQEAENSAAAIQRD